MQFKAVFLTLRKHACPYKSHLCQSVAFARNITELYGVGETSAGCCERARASAAAARPWQHHSQPPAVPTALYIYACSASRHAHPPKAPSPWWSYPPGARSGGLGMCRGRSTVHRCRALGGRLSSSGDASVRVRLLGPQPRASRYKAGWWRAVAATRTFLSLSPRLEYPWYT